jgi:hypothetical protein
VKTLVNGIYEQWRHVHFGHPDMRILYYSINKDGRRIRLKFIMLNTRRIHQHIYSVSVSSQVTKTKTDFLLYAAGTTQHGASAVKTALTLASLKRGWEQGYYYWSKDRGLGSEVNSSRTLTQRASICICSPRSRDRTAPFW